MPFDSKLPTSLSLSTPSLQVIRNPNQLGSAFFAGTGSIILSSMGFSAL